MKFAIEKRLHAKDKHSQKKVQRYQANFHVLLSRTLLLPLLVNDLIHMRHGYQSGCVLLQQTKAVFFKLHLHAAQMWWQCMWLGASQWERHALLHHICWSVGKASGIIAGASHNGEAQAKAWCFRCRFCGLLSSTGMYTHLANYHPPASWIYQRHLEWYEPCRVLQKQRFVIEQKPLSNTNMGQDSFAGLALRQPGVIVPSLETSCCFLRFRTTVDLHGCRRHSCSAPRAAWHLRS